MIRHPADIANVARAVAAPVIFFMPFGVGFPDGYEIISVVIIYMLVGKTNYILHLHIHRPFSNYRAVNLFLDCCMGAVTGMTASNWRIQHLYGHHRGNDAFRGDVSWEVEMYSPWRALSYCFRTIWPTFWKPYAEAFRKGMVGNTTQPISYRWAFAEQTLLLSLVAMCVVINPSIALLYAIPMYIVTYLISRYVDYLNHYGCDEASPNTFEHANNSLNRPFNRLCNNFGYHTAHHLRPGAHWTELPHIHNQISDKIPDRCKKSFSWSFMLFPYHMFLSRFGRM